MKNLFGILLLCICALQANAKARDSAKLAKQYRNEIGISLPIAADALFKASDMGLFGVQYRRVINNTYGYRIVGGWGLYNNWEDKVIKRTNNRLDTGIRMNIQTGASLAVLGAGIDIQRQFYKKVYFFAAVEFKTGYGTGGALGTIEIDHDIAVDSGTIHQYSYHSDVYQDTKLFYISLSPIVGAKLQFGRLSTGIEVHGIDAAYQYISNPLGKYSFISSNDVTYGLFFNYRF